MSNREVRRAFRINNSFLDNFHLLGLHLLSLAHSDRS